MYGLDRFSVFVDKRPLTFTQTEATLNGTLKQERFRKRANILNSVQSLDTRITSGTDVENVIGEGAGFESGATSKFKLNEFNLCNFVTRINYAIFAPEIHLQCNRPLVGRYIYIQADGRSNRWSRLFSAVLCEIQVYEN